MKAMKSHHLIFTVAALTILCSFMFQPKPWDIPAEFKNKKNPLPKTEKVLAEGKAKYNQVCAGCHGLTGKGDGEKVKSLTHIKPACLVLDNFTKETDGEHFYKIKYGRDRNHSFAGKVDDEGIWAIVHYMKTFSNK